MKNEESVRDYMSTKLITFTPDVDITEAIKTLLNNKISGAPVVDSTGKLVGMLSEKDCIRLLVDGPYNQIPTGDGQVKDYMAVNVTTIDIKTTILEAAFNFAHSKYKRFPILEEGKLVGQLSRSDVLKAISKLRPTVKVTPDSWKRRMPVMNPSKTGRHNENA